MKTSKRILFILIWGCITICNSFSQKTTSVDTTFLDQRYFPCDRMWAYYYSLAPKKEGDLYLFEFFRLSGLIHRKGYSNTQDTTIWEGEVLTFEYERARTVRESFLNGVILSSKSIEKDGRVSGEAYFKNGKPHGPAYYTNPINGAGFEGQFREGKKDGLWKVFGGGHSLKSEYKVLDGKLHGNFFQIDYAVTDEMVGEFDHGTIITFKKSHLYNSCQWIHEIRTENGIEYWKSYMEGKLILESSFLDGKRAGEWKLHSFEGNHLFRVAHYSPECDTDNTPQKFPLGQGELPNPSYGFPKRFSRINEFELLGDGCMHGEFIEYDKNGNPYLTIDFENGKVIGTPLKNTDEGIILQPIPSRVGCGKIDTQDPYSDPEIEWRYQD